MISPTSSSVKTLIFEACDMAAMHSLMIMLFENMTHYDILTRPTIRVLAKTLVPTWVRSVDLCTLAACPNVKRYGIRHPNHCMRTANSLLPIESLH